MLLVTPERTAHRRPSDSWRAGHRYVKIEATGSHQSGDTDKWLEHMCFHFHARTLAWCIALDLPLPTPGGPEWPVDTLTEGDDGLDITAEATPHTAMVVEPFLLATGFSFMMVV